MRLPYDLIFESGGVGDDATLSECGLSRSFTRFLFAVIDCPHVFYSGDERVELSDTERQLLEKGIAVLTNLECPMTVLVGDYYLANHLTIGTGSIRTQLPFASGFLNSDYVFSPVLPGTIDIAKDGLYSVLFSIRVNGALTPSGDFSHLSRLEKNGGGAKVQSDWRWSNWDTIDLYYINNLVAGDRLVFIYEQYSGGDISLQSGQNTGIKVVYHG